MYSMILHGRRSLELQKWRHWGVAVQNAFAFSSSTSSANAAADMSLQDCGKGKNFTVSYLVGSLGLTTKLAESISRKVSFEEKGNPDSVLNLFRSQGFTNSQISSIITMYPPLLILDAEKTIGPKLEFLQSRGASTSELTEVLSKVPKILGMKEEKTMGVYYDFVKEIIKADKSSKFKTLCHPSLQQGRKQLNKVRNLLVLRELGVPQRLLFPLFMADTRPICGKEKFEVSLKRIVEMGFDPTTFRFLEALRVLYQLSGKTIDEKMSVYKRFGLSVGDFWEMFKKWPYYLRYTEKKVTQTFETLNKCGLLEDEALSVVKRFPYCIGYSRQRIEKTVETFLGLGFTRDEFVRMVKAHPPCITHSVKMVKEKAEFLVKKMNWPLKALVSNPAVISYSMEKRIVPRCNVIKALMSKGLLGSELPSVGSVLICNDKVFLERYLNKLDDKELVAELIAYIHQEATTLSNSQQ